MAIFLFAAVAALMAPLAGSEFGRDRSAAAAENVYDALFQARSEAMSGRSPGSFGVALFPDSLAYFAGDLLDLNDPDTFLTDFGGGIVLSWDLGGDDAVVFSGHRGLPSASGTVTVSAGAGQLRTVRVGPSGAIGTERGSAE